MRHRHRSLILALALASAVVVTYWPLGGNGFVDFDDNAYVTENPRVLAGLSPAGIAWAFTSLHAANWHPLTWVSHLIDVELFGLDAGRHHLTSLLILVLDALLLFSFLRAATGAFWRSGLAAALFALHPLRVESVAWVAQRKDVLALLFLLLTLGAYRRYVSGPTPGRYGATLALYAAGLMAKPTLVTVPAALLLLDRWPFGRLGGPRPAEAGGARWQPSAPLVLVEKLPFLLLAAAVSAGTFFAQSRGGAVNTLAEWPLRDRLFTALTGYAAYLGKTFLPLDLAVYYPVPQGGFTAAAAAASLALIAALTALVLIFRQRLPCLEFGWSWYLLTLLPVIGLVQTGTQAIADRYLLLPHIGLAVAASWGPAGLLKTAPRPRHLAVPAALLALLALSLQTHRQIAFWRDSATLFRHALAVTADNWLIHYNFGGLLKKQGSLAEAAVQLEAAVGAKPDFADAHNNLGDVLLAMGRAPAAEGHFLKAIEIFPGHLQARNNLGAALMDRGEYAGAVRSLSEAVALDPGYADARFNLASAYLATGDRAAAIREFREALRLNPEDALSRYQLQRLLSPAP